MMTCEACRQHIAATGGADPLPDEVMAHIAQCPGCAELLTAERHVRVAMSRVPWPDSPLTRDLAGLRARAATLAAARGRSRRRRTLGRAAGLGAAVAVAGLAIWLLRAGSGAAALPPAGVVGLLLVAGLLWAGLELAGRRLASTGSSAWAVTSVALARAGLVLGLVVLLLHPAVRPTVEDALWSTTAQPVGADSVTFEATVICVGKDDGRLRLVRWEAGCRGSEWPVPPTGLGISGLPTAGNGAELRAGTATIPAGLSSTFVNFSQPMPSADYRVALTPTNPGRPFATDESCRFLAVAGKTTSGFNVTIRRCWFKGPDVPFDPAATDGTLDWIALAPR